MSKLGKEHPLNANMRFVFAAKHSILTHGAYEQLLDELATIRVRKVAAYGEDRYGNLPDYEQKALTYSDIYRKFIRIKQLMLTANGSVVRDEAMTATDGESLRDTLMDMANYCLMGVQLMDSGKLADVLVADVAEVEAETKQLKIDQVAVTSEDPEALKRSLEEIFRLKPGGWHDDVVVSSGTVFGKEKANRARLSFHYGLIKEGVEFEVLSYDPGEMEPDEGANNFVNHPDSLVAMAGFPCLSHIGVHVDDIDEWYGHMSALGYSVIQSVRTLSHTNPKIKDSRRYRYMIFDTHATIGFYLKLIQRLPFPNHVVQPKAAVYIVELANGEQVPSDVYEDIQRLPYEAKKPAAPSTVQYIMDEAEGLPSDVYEDMQKAVRLGQEVAAQVKAEPTDKDRSAARRSMSSPYSEAIADAYGEPSQEMEDLEDRVLNEDPDRTGL